jgi:hypothetical protein
MDFFTIECLMSAIRIRAMKSLSKHSPVPAFRLTISGPMEVVISLSAIGFLASLTLG